MKRVQAIIEKHVSRVIKNLGGDIQEGCFELLDTPDSSKGDFALNSALKSAKKLKRPPMEIAGKIAEILKTENQWFKEIIVAPPGFINLFLTDSVIEKLVFDTISNLSESLINNRESPTVIVDYSGVNISKQMHVGHLRSTIIGDVIARVLLARGATVIKQNHLGDWGLPIAMVLWKAQPFIRDAERKMEDISSKLSLPKMEELYREAAKLCQTDPEVDKQCHQVLISLQNRDPQLISDWKLLSKLSMDEVYRIYRLLDVLLTEEDEKGESSYQDLLESTVEAIERSGRLVTSQGARCVFLDNFKTKDGSPLPVIVQKSDGGFNYETFDLAGIHYRINELKADRIIYVHDARQALHFSQVFQVAKDCGWTDGEKTVTMEHVAFGTILGEDNKPLKTRSGENVKLSDLLNDAISRAYSVVQEKNPGLPEEKKKEVAHSVGLGAVKYADLSQNRNNDYVFSWDRMLALNGNTAPYLQYAHARICSIFRKTGISQKPALAQPRISDPTERQLLLKLNRFPEVVALVEKDLRPHFLCNYLFELATLFSSFYDQCPVLGANSQEDRESRLTICEMVRVVLESGLNLLGIAAPQEM